MFDVPMPDRQGCEWTGDAPVESRDWNVGLIVGPSGCGKSTLARQMFGEPAQWKWGSASVVDDFAPALSMKDISETCQAVGFNTIPAWMRPFHVLSGGEQFRVMMARALLEAPSPVVVDEFTSVVDRQVAQIGSHAVQKIVRRRNQRFVAVSCHYDIIDWLQPDWTLEPATMTFTWRSLQRRPPLDCTIGRVPRAAWPLFAPYHYMSADLSAAAQCFGLWCNGTLAAFCGTLFRPHPRVRDIVGVSRIVTLPDFQGVGLAMVLAEQIGSAYRSIGMRLHHYPAHPSLIRSLDRSPNWALEKHPGVFSSRASASSTAVGAQHQRPCAVFSYQGAAMDKAEARRLLGSATFGR